MRPLSRLARHIRFHGCEWLVIALALCTALWMYGNAQQADARAALEMRVAGR